MHASTRVLSAPAAAVALLALCDSALAATVTTNCNKVKPGATCSASAGPLRAGIVASTHTPVINAKWPLKATATLGGKPARATAEYQFLFGGIVVATQYPRSNKHFTFTGQFSDILVFPPDSEGQPLTLQVVVSSGVNTVRLAWLIDSKK
jgi:hypothetical protein